MIGLYDLSLTALFVLLETIEHCLYRRASGDRTRRLWLAAGIAMNLIGMAIWLEALRTARLGQLLPLLAASNVTIALSGVLFFNERVSRRRWIGISLVTLGVTIVSSALI